MNKLLIATFNKGKLQDYKEFLKDLPLELVTLNDIGITKEFEEIYETFEENSKGKAEYYNKLSGLPTLADDSGIEIPFYDMKPGVYTKNWAEVEAGDVDHHQFRIDKIKAIPKDQRQAQLRAVLALAFSGQVHMSEGVIKGVLTDIVYPHSDTHGYPWDRVFIIPELNKYYEELNEEENYKYNHRRIALDKLKPLFDY
jgi:XTP/dITP diphosphohydrolase